MHALYSQVDIYPFVDFHTHKARHGDSDEVIEIISVHLGQAIPAGYYTIGMHPWWTEKIRQEDIATLKHHMTHDEYCLGLGEVGLDNLKGADMVTQMDNLGQLLDVAASTGRPVVLHSVRAYHQLQQIKKDFPHIEKWVIHGYPRHRTLAFQLLDQGFLLSLMPVREINSTYIELVSSLPADRFFLETDSMPKAQIVDIYSRAAQIRGVELPLLRQQLLSNTKAFFAYE